MLMLIDCKDRVVHKVQYGVPMDEIWPRDQMDLQSLGGEPGDKGRGSSTPNSAMSAASDSDFGVELKTPSKNVRTTKKFILS